MSTLLGHFVWRELMTPDVERSRAFYEGLLGWGITQMEMPPGSPMSVYVMHTVGDRPQGGYVSLEGMEHPPHWMPYVGVDDIEATCARARAAGGLIAVEPMDVGPGVFAVIGDPQGGWITAWKSKEDDLPALSMEEMGPGHFCWEQLNTSDLEGAVAFYTKVFGWTVGEYESMPTFRAGDVPIANIMPAPDGAPTHWLSHVIVADLTSAENQATAEGATVLAAGIGVPGIGTFSVVMDPVGAAISLFQPSAPA